MKEIKLRIITPKKIVLETEISSATLPAATGEVTILPEHVPYFALLNEGLITIKSKTDESFFSIGSGYVETDGKSINILVSRAYGQDELNEDEILHAKKEAEKLVSIAKTDIERQQALQLLRRSVINIKLLDKIKKNRQHIRKNK